MNRPAAISLVLVCACGARTELAGTHAANGKDASAGDGGCQDEIIATDPDGATALALDGDAVFWGTTDGFVRARDASGTTTTLASEGQTIDSIAVDATNVYYAITGSVKRVSRAGGQVADLAANVGEPFALAVSDSPELASPAVYYVDYGAGIAAGSVSAIAIGSGKTEPIVAGLDTPGGMAVDADYVYVASAFADVDGLTYQGPLFRIAKNGLARSTLASNLHQPSSVVTYDGRVYYVEQVDASSALHGGVRSVPVAGGATKIEMTTDGYLPLDVAVDASGVYATAFSQEKGALERAGAAGAPVEVASTPGVQYGLVRTSATAIYWTIQWTGAPPADGASVRKVCK